MSKHKCSGCNGAGQVYDFLCVVCDGRGVISDAMPAKDALADAETLRLYLGWRVDGDGPYMDRSDKANAMRRALRQAEYQGHSGDAVVVSRRKRIVLGQWHARSAFRAVLGLRG